jgi:DNA invertase Pin-like site-specific DNA recombinase
MSHKKKPILAKAALYCRLSRDDGMDTESNSIGNQRELLVRFAGENNILVIGDYVDDGISGTTFERPSFRRMVEDIESGAVNTVIVKDLSRLGRNNAMVAYYTEMFFPQNDIRFIAVNDGIDTFRGENEIMGFKSILNEYYARDISKKIRSSFRVKAQKGDFIGTNAPYGYKKDPENKNKLVPDPTAAEVVKRIFSLAASGKSTVQIKTILTNEEILTPKSYLFEQTGKYGTEINREYPCAWTARTLSHMLRNRVYLGDMVSGKQTIKSFKQKKRINLEAEMWIAVPNTHEAIIDNDTFEAVQKQLGKHRPVKQCSIDNVFVGKVVCADCGFHLAYSQGRLICNGYKRHSKSCSPHSITYETLTEIVKNELKIVAEYAKKNEPKLLEYARDIIENKTGKNAFSKEKELKNITSRLKEIDDIIANLLEQNTTGMLTSERFINLLDRYENETKNLSEKKKGVEFENQKKAATFDLSFITEIDTLAPEIINLFIEKIIVHEKDRQKKTQKLEISLNFQPFLCSQYTVLHKKPAQHTITS